MLRRSQGDELSNMGARESSRPTVRVDASLQSLMQRHRELQEELTDEMVMLSLQLKENSLMIDQALHETHKVLESTEDAVECSLASTNKANVCMGALSSQSWKTWKTCCLTWIIMFVVFELEVVWWKTKALLLEGDSIKYFRATLPLNLATPLIAEVSFVGGAKYYRLTNKLPLGSNLDRLYSGGAFNPLGLAMDLNQLHY